MTNETNAALSALKADVTEIESLRQELGKARPYGIAIGIRQDFDVLIAGVNKAIRDLEASQREAPVAERADGLVEEFFDEWEEFVAGPEAREALTGKINAFVSDRLTASRPAAESVVSRDAIEKVVEDWMNEHHGASVDELMSWPVVDAIFALQLPAPKPSRENDKFENLVTRLHRVRGEPDKLNAIVMREYAALSSRENVVICPDCGGAGTAPGSTNFCRRCGGRATIPSRPPVTEPEGEAVEAAIKAFDELSVENQLHTMGDSEVQAVHGSVAMRLREILGTLLAALKELPK